MKLDSVNEKLSSLINATSMVQLGTYILEQINNNKQDKIYNFNLIINETALDRRDIVNTLINFNRLGILDQLQFKEDDNASFNTNIEKMQSYLKRISLNPARG